MTTLTNTTSAAALIAISTKFNVIARYETLQKLLEIHKLQEIEYFPWALVKPNSAYWHGGVLLGFGETPDRSNITPAKVTLNAGADQYAFSNATLGIPALLLTLFQITPGTGSPAGKYMFLPGGNKLYGVDELFKFKEVALE